MEIASLSGMKPVTVENLSSETGLLPTKVVKQVLLSGYNANSMKSMNSLTDITDRNQSLHNHTLKATQDLLCQCLWGIAWYISVRIQWKTTLLQAQLNVLPVLPALQSIMIHLDKTHTHDRFCG